MKVNAIAFFTFILIFTSCTILGSDPIKSKIVGQWEWVKSTGGFAGHIVTPDSTGYSKQQIQYSANNEFSFFRADTLVVSGRYFLEKDKGNIVVKYNIRSSPSYPSQRIEFENNETLILMDECIDCYTRTYKRKN